jgi:hypothetical protein
MFGLFSGRKKARESAMVTILNDLLLQFGGYVDFDPEKFVRIIKDDPYVGGYLSGKVTCDASIHMKNAGLHKDDFSEVTGAVLLGLFGTTYLPNVSSACRQHTQVNSIQFQDGNNKGADVAIFLRGLRSQGRSMTEHPDYKRAVDALKASNFPDDLIRGNAYMGFHFIWFTEYMIEKHGYSMMTQLMSMHSKPRIA